MYQCIVTAAYTKCWCCLIQLTVKKAPLPPVSIPLPPLPILVPCIRNVLCHHQPSRPYRVPTNLLKSSSSWFDAFFVFVVVRRSHNGGNDEGLGPVCNCAYCLRMNDLIVFWSYAVTEANKDGGIYLGFAWALWDDDMVGWWPMRSRDLQITIHPSIHPFPYQHPSHPMRNQHQSHDDARGVRRCLSRHNICSSLFQFDCSCPQRLQCPLLPADKVVDNVVDE